MDFEPHLLHFWNSTLSCLTRPALLSGNAQISTYLRGAYDMFASIFGHDCLQPSFAEYLERHPLRSSLLSHPEIDATMLCHEYWIAERLGNQLVDLWLPGRESPFRLAEVDQSCVFLGHFGTMLQGRLYSRPLDPAISLQRLALESTRTALEHPPVFSPPAALELPPETLLWERYEALHRLPRCWAAAALQRGDLEELGKAVQSCQDPVVWMWAALHALAQRELPHHWTFPFLPGYEGLPLLGAGWKLLRAVGELDPDNGVADLLRAYRHLQLDVLERAEECVLEAAAKLRCDFYRREMAQSTQALGDLLGDSPKKARMRALTTGASGWVLFRYLPSMLSENTQEAVLRGLVHIAKSTIRESTLIVDQNFGLYLWDRVSRFLPDQCTEVQSWRDRIGSAQAWIQRVEDDQLSDSAWVTYLDQVFAESELAAIEQLQRQGLVPRGQHGYMPEI